MLLYVHVPFCRAKCRYCSFYSVVPGPEDMARYVDSLLAEIALWRSRLGRARLSTIYFGGGTPSLLPLSAVAEISRALRKAFRLESDLEFTFEANPESVIALGYMHGLIEAGVNRLSLGVQSTHDHYLEVLGRPHDAKTALGAMRLARDAGFTNISLDLIWGLPKQRLYTWMQQLREIVKLKPDHLSCYGLSLDPGTPLAKAAEAHDLDFAPDDDLARMFVYGAEFLESEGYLQYEISNFARMGFTSRHNLGYWEGRNYLGLGPSAVSTVRGLRWENPRDLKAWAEAAKTSRMGGKPERLDFDSRVRELVMLRLRTARGLRLRAYSKLTGRAFTRDFAPLVKALRANGLIRISQGYIRLTKTGMAVSDTILANMFAMMD